jgi:hypothetical protein
MFLGSSALQNNPYVIHNKISILSAMDDTAVEW